ncbi:Ionotropic receptor 623 [Blattella germanica]|nr:Ionotropic receptor 623 [Blattella germanica]
MILMDVTIQRQTIKGVTMKCAMHPKRIVGKLFWSVFLPLVFPCVRGLLSEEQTHILSCIKEILHHHLIQTRSIVVSFSKQCEDPTTRPLGITLSSDHLHLVTEVVSTINNFTLTKVLRPSSENNEVVEKEINSHDSDYIIFLFSCGRLEANNDTKDLEYKLEEQMQQIMHRLSFNPRGKYVFVTDSNEEETALLASRLINKLWRIVKNVNFVFLIQNIEENILPEEFSGTNDETAMSVHVYTWFPYINGTCYEFDNAVLLNKWLPKNGGQFLMQENLFRYITPADFEGCPLRVATIGPEPYVIPKVRFINNEQQLLDLEGLCVNFIHTFSEKFNFTLEFLPPLPSVELDAIFSIGIDAQSSRSDIVLGVVALSAVFLPYIDITRPLVFETAGWIVPCPQPVERIGRVIRIFSSCTWMFIFIISLFSSIVIFLQAANDEKEVKTFKTLVLCFYYAWAVLLGISVPQMPTSSNTRIFFLLYIWYSIAVNMIFQAFFVTYLVQPGYEERIQTFDDLKKLNIPFSFPDLGFFLLDSLDYNPQTQLTYAGKCANFHSCSETVIFHRNLSSGTIMALAYHLAHTLAVRDVNSVVCFLDENIISGYFPAGLPKGSPLFAILNEHITRITEFGLIEHYSSQLEHEIQLEAKYKYEESELYFVFSMLHLSPIFMLLIVGWALSFVLFFLEVLYSQFKRGLFTKKISQQIFLRKYYSKICRFNKY